MLTLGAVIGVHAVVTHDVESFFVVAGVPGEELYRRFENEVINRLLELK